MLFFGKGKPKMHTVKVLVASDIHGSATYARGVLDAFEREGADRLALLGDILYHGPRNPLPDGYSPKDVAGLLNGYADRIIAVRGNCDSEVDQLVLDFHVLNDYAVLFLDGVAVHLAHGHKDTPPLNHADVYITGHTHVPLNTREEGFLHLNPGSVALPKDGKETRGYILYEDGTFYFKTLDGTVYDMAKI